LLETILALVGPCALLQPSWGGGSRGQLTGVPARAWIVAGAGTAVNLCLGILYAWSVWKANLIADSKHAAGSPMAGLNEGWTYLSDAEATWAYALCGVSFALFMIPAGRLQDRVGPKLGAILGGLCLASGCLLAGLLKSSLGLILGFGLLGGLGMGLGYAAATPAAVRWFDPPSARPGRGPGGGRLW
jgi:OFA family oxalate/formate antiporter-like MFS transporter